MEMPKLKLAYQKKQLQGINFSGQDLSESNFYGADIRGANFSDCKLDYAAFQDVRAGLSTRWIIRLYGMTIFLCLLAGLISGYSGALISNLFSGQSEGFIFGIISLILTFVFLSNILVKGLSITLVILSELTVAALIVAMAIFPNDQAMLAVDAQFTILSIAGYTAGLINIAAAISIAKLAKLFRFKAILLAISSLGLLIGILFGVSQPPGYPIALIIGLLTITTGYFVGLKAVFVDPENKYEVLLQLAKTIVTKGATNFRGASLVSADFSGAHLSNTDLRDSILTKSNWKNVQGLGTARLEGTYLENIIIQELVTTRSGSEKEFTNVSLRNLNLESVNFEKADLSGSDLSSSNLKDANLKGAILVRTQLYHSVLDSANLTGAIIENWGISTNVSFEGVKCDYVYTRLPTEDDRDPCRKPDKKNTFFEPGDFADFITPFIKTLDLYKSQGVDILEIGRKFKTIDLIHADEINPGALSQAFYIVANKYPEAGLDILAIEGKRNDKVRIQAKVADSANRQKIYEDYFEAYNQLLLSQDTNSSPLLARLDEKDQRIINLEKILENALGQSKFYIETFMKGDFVMSQSNKGNVSISGVSGNVSSIAAAGEDQVMTGVTLGEVSGSVTNAINQLSDRRDDDVCKLRDLLSQLQISVENESELTDGDKIEALEQIKVIAEASQNPEDKRLIKAGRTAAKILKGTVSSLSDAANLVSTFEKIMPVLAGLLPFI